MNKLVVLIVLFFICFYSCNNISTAIDEKPKVEEELRKEILEQHNLQRDYHFNKMARKFAAQLSANHISVNRGEIKQLTKDEHIERFTNYFNAVTFEKWDDVTPPIIRFSNDYSIAYTIVEKDVVVQYKNDNDSLVREQTNFAWVAIYKKYPDGWKIDCVGSTNKLSKIL